MGWDAWLYLGVTFVFFVLFAVIVFRTYRKGAKGEKEAPKYRMLEEDQEKE